ncbi:clusterin-associated protein 1 [Pelomyxa schiedti]|nr:clusterin-associated protein 1 [Pelomyxa schiedti]
MSFKELRSFSEILRGLGYPKVVSVEGFRTPSFEHMRTLATWLAQRYDPNITLPTECSNEEERVNFVKVIVSEMYNKAQITLNPKRLYHSDSLCVRELLKMATLLRQSSTTQTNALPEETRLSTTWIQDLRETKELSNSLVDTGGSVFTLLDTALDDADRRVSACTQDMDQIRKIVSLKTRALQEEIETLRSKLENVLGDEENLKTKLELKKRTLEDARMKLKNHQVTKPAFMDEYEALQHQLQQKYSDYIVRFRNLDYLEFQLEMRNKAELSKNETQKRRFKKLRNKEERIQKATLREGGRVEAGEGGDDDGDDTERFSTAAETTDSGGELSNEELRAVDEEFLELNSNVMNTQLRRRIRQQQHRHPNDTMPIKPQDADDISPESSESEMKLVYEGGEAPSNGGRNDTLEADAANDADEADGDGNEEDEGAGDDEGYDDDGGGVGYPQDEYPVGADYNTSMDPAAGAEDDDAHAF